MSVLCLQQGGHSGGGITLSLPSVGLDWSAYNMLSPRHPQTNTRASALDGAQRKAHGMACLEKETTRK